MSETTSRSSNGSPFATLLTRWRDACREVWRRKWLWLFLTAALPIWLLLDYQWAGIPLAKTWQVLVVAISGLLLLAAAGYALRVVFRAVRWPAALHSFSGWATLLVWAVPGVWLPYRLLWFVVPLGSIASEAVSAAVRFALADVLAMGSLLWLAAALTPPSTQIRPPDGARS